MLNTRLVDEAVNKSGGEKKSLQRMVLNGQIDQLTATIAAMRIDRIQNAAKLDQLNQPTVAEQVLNPQPQPQMPPQGMAAMPQAQQMPPQAQMGQPAQQPMMAARGGMLEIPYNEGDYAAGGIVSFNQGGGGYGEAMAQLRRQLGAARTQAQRDQITAAMNQLRAQQEGSTYQPALAAADLSTATEEQTGGNRFNTGSLTQAEAERIEGRDMMDNVERGFGMFTDFVKSKLPSFGSDDPDEFAKVKNAQPSEVPGEEARQARVAAMTGRQPAGVEAIASPEDLLNVGMETFADTDSQRVAQTAPMRSTDLSTAAQQNFIAGLTPEQKAMRAGLGELAASETLAMLGERKGTGANETFVSPERIRAARVRGAPDLLDEGDLNIIRTGRGNVIEQPGERDAYNLSRFGSGRGGDPFAFGEAERGGPAPTVEEQVKKTQDEAAVLGGKTDTTIGGAPVNMDKPAEPEPTGASEIKGIEGYLDELKKLRNDVDGPYVKELKDMLAKRGDTLSAAKKDAFSLAFLQTGLGMLAQEGQPGGVLQSLGKAGLPAMKEAVGAIKEAKKEDRELLKLGASIEQAEGKRQDALLNSAIQMHGKDKTAAATIEAAKINANRVTDLDKKINALVSGYKAADKALGKDIKSDEVYQSQAVTYLEEMGVKRAQVAAGASVTKTVTSETEDWRGRREEFIAGLEGTDGLTAKAQWAANFKKSEGRTPTDAEWQQEKQRRISEWNQRNPQPGTAAIPAPDPGQQSAIVSGAGTVQSPFVLNSRPSVSQMVQGKVYTFPNGITATYIGNGKFKPIK